MTMPALLLQKPHLKSKTWDHKSSLSGCLELWENGNISEVNWFKAICAPRHPTNDNEKLACTFSKLTMSNEIVNSRTTRQDQSEDARIRSHLKSDFSRKALVQEHGVDISILRCRTVLGWTFRGSVLNMASRSAWTMALLSMASLSWLFSTWLSTWLGAWLFSTWLSTQLGAWLFSTCVRTALFSTWLHTQLGTWLFSPVWFSS